MLAIDIHQHAWPEELLTGLERRAEAPRARRADGRWCVELAAEPAFTVADATHGVAARARAVSSAGLDRALVALSSPVGIEALPAAEAEPLLDAWGSAALPEPLERWAAVSLEDPDAGRLGAALDAGAVGACLPAGALDSPVGLERLGGVLETLERRLAPLFVHPGPGRGPSALPGWWAPAVDYVGGLHAAWHAFAAWGRPAHPRLRVVFAALAGLAPLHGERTELRGGPPATGDPLVFYDISSYGRRALQAMAGAVGPAQLVNGSDAPVAVPPGASPLGRAYDELMRTDNVARLLGRAWDPEGPQA